VKFAGQPSFKHERRMAFHLADMKASLKSVLPEGKAEGLQA
jgi:hypothetical protein